MKSYMTVRTCVQGLRRASAREAPLHSPERHPPERRHLSALFPLTGAQAGNCAPDLLPRHATRQLLPRVGRGGSRLREAVWGGLAPVSPELTLAYVT